MPTGPLILSLRLFLSLRLSLQSGADPAPESGPCPPNRTLNSTPGLRGHIKVAEGSRVTDRPRSVQFPQGQQNRHRENPALEENDLGGLRRRPRLDC